MSRFFYSASLLIAFAFAGSVNAIPAKAEGVDTNDSLRAALQVLEDRVRFMEHQLNLFNFSLQNTKVVESNDSTGLDNLVATRNGLFLPGRQSSGHIGQGAGGDAAANNQRAAELSGLEISGFMDVVYEARAKEDSPDQAALNQVELDLARTLGERANAELAIAYDETFGIGAAILNYSLLTEVESENERTRLLNEWVVSVGQFDVPFGLDYFSYASADRLLITQPKICSATHGSWNDVGVLTTFAGNWGSVHAYSVKGFETRTWQGDGAIEDATEDDEGWFVAEPRASAGLRLNAALHSALEIGASASRGFDKENRSAFTLLGTHASIQYRNLHLDVELINLSGTETHTPVVTNGGYVEAVQHFGNPYVIGRHDFITSDKSPLNQGYSFGGGTIVTDGLEVRSELLWQEQESHPQLYFYKLSPASNMFARQRPL